MVHLLLYTCMVSGRWCNTGSVTPLCKEVEIRPQIVTQGCVGCAVYKQASLGTSGMSSVAHCHVTSLYLTCAYSVARMALTLDLATRAS